MLTDRRALLAIMKSHHSNKSYSTRLTRRLGRLLRFHFNMEQIPSIGMGQTDYVLRQPIEKTKIRNCYDEKFMTGTIDCNYHAITPLFKQSDNLPHHTQNSSSKQKNAIWTPVQLCQTANHKQIKVCSPINQSNFLLKLNSPN